MNRWIEVFGKAGSFLREWGSYGDDDGLLENPMGVAVSGSRTLVYVADTGNYRIQVFAGYGPCCVAGRRMVEGRLEFAGNQ